MSPAGPSMLDALLTAIFWTGIFCAAYGLYVLAVRATQAAIERGMRGRWSR